MAYAATAPVETRLVIGQAIALLSVVAVVAGARRWATLRRSWYLIALGAFGFLAAGTVISELAKANGGIPPFPSMGDGIFYSGYFCLIGGGVSLIRSRSRRRDWANFVDAAIVAAGLGLLVWAFIMAPYAQQGSLPLFDRVLSSGYSAMDLVLLGVWARLAIGPGARNTSYYLIATCFTFVLVADLLTTLTTAGAYNGFLTPIISTLGFVACGTGALHPSMARLTERDHVPTVLTKRRLALLGFALAMAPGVLAIEALTGRPVDGSTVVVGVFVLASLVLVRMVLLLRVNERKARRERILREASLVLVGATTKEEMHDGALSAVLAIIGTKAGGRASLATGFDGTMRVVASVGAGARYALGHVVDTDGLPADLAGALAERRTQAVHGTRPVDLRDTEQREGSVAMDGVSVTLLPLVSQNELRGAIVVTSDAPVAAELVESVSDFAAEVALALETAALIEDQHRRKSERRFKAMIEHSSDLLTVVGPEGTIIFASPSASRVAGVDAATLIGAEPFGNAHPEDRQTITGLLENAVRRPVGPASPVEVRVQHPDGGWRWFETIATNLTRDAEVGGIVLTSRDVTDRKAADLRLTESEARFRSLVQNSSDVVAVLDEGGVASYVSSAVDRVLGYDADVMLGRSVVDLVHADDAAAMVEVLAAAVHAGAADVQCRAEVRVRHADGSWHTLDLTVSDLRHEPSVAGLVLNARDVTDRKELEGELHFRSLHDSLTGLANRDLFADRVAHALRRRSDREDMVAVLFVDLDDFKSVNESLGHAAGDEVLKTVADRLGQCLRSADTPARLGADEFAVLVEDVYTEEQVVALAQRVMEEIQRPFEIDGREVHCGASIGIAVDEARALSAGVLLRNADAAKYLAKERGKARFVVFEESMHAAAYERMELKSDMPGALTSGQFAVHYQPIVDLETGELDGVEALLRWTHPTRGFVGPDVFIPVAEHSGFITTLGAWVLDQACADLRRWRDADPDGRTFHMSVNLSVRQLEQPSLAADVAAALARHGLSAEDLVLEITESVLMTDAAAAHTRLEEIRALGVRTALDDFGTGYSSLRYIDKLPVDVVKIDRSFVARLGEDPTVVQAVVDLAGKLRLTLVAEGIEELEQWDILKGMGCDHGQGYYFARPMPAADLQALAAARRRPAPAA